MPLRRSYSMSYATLNSDVREMYPAMPPITPRTRIQ